MDDVLLIGKVIQKKKKVKRIYEIILMCKSEIQINNFTENECKKMIKCDTIMRKSHANVSNVKPGIIDRISKTEIEYDINKVTLERKNNNNNNDKVTTLKQKKIRSKKKLENKRFK